MRELRSAFAEAGLSPGNRVASVLPNGPEAELGVSVFRDPKKIFFLRVPFGFPKKRHKTRYPQKYTLTQEIRFSAGNRRLPAFSWAPRSVGFASGLWTRSSPRRREAEVAMGCRTFGDPILGWTSIHLPPILMFTRGTGF